MQNCFLCAIHPADKTGSHIIPHFLSKRIDNEEAHYGRDKELGFDLSKLSTVSYFGRAVQPEKLEEIYGEVTEELISKNKISGIVDHYFCSNCEDKLAIIESKYATTLNKETTFEDNYTGEQQIFIGFLFWCSIVWRLSIQIDSGFKLKIKEEKRLRRILNRYLSLDIKKVAPNNEDPDLHDVGYKLLRSPNFSDQHPTWLYWEPSYERPYSLIIDEYLLFFYFKKSYLNGMVVNFLDSEEMKRKATYNTPFKEERIYGVGFEDYQKSCDKVLSLAGKTRINELNIILDSLHRRLGGRGRTMYPLLKEEILKRMNNNDIPIGKRHTMENYKKIISETMIEFCEREAKLQQVL